MTTTDDELTAILTGHPPEGWASRVPTAPVYTPPRIVDGTVTDTIDIDALIGDALRDTPPNSGAELAPWLPGELTLPLPATTDPEPEPTDTFPRRVRQSLIDGEGILAIGATLIAGVGIATVVTFIIWFIEHWAVATVILLLLLIPTAVALNPGPKYLYLKGCPTRSPGAHKFRLRD